MTYDELADYCKEASKTISKLDYKNRMLEKENQELKKQLHEASLTIQEMTEQDIECPSNCEKLRQLKKQVENYKKLGFKYLQDKNNNLETQQKEFIKYLEDEIKLYENDIQNFKKDYKVYFSLINDLRVNKAKIEENLQKYKEIIGDDK